MWRVSFEPCAERAFSLDFVGEERQRPSGRVVGARCQIEKVKSAQDAATINKDLPQIVSNLAVHVRIDLSRRLFELAVFDARFYIRVRRINEPA